MEIAGVDVRVVEACPSTNSALLEDRSSLERPIVLLAEHQTRGRGRRGRRWASPAGHGLTFSLARAVHRPPRELPALSLVAGVAAARALRALGVSQAALKWPNDIVVDGAKLGGILVETRAFGRAIKAVIGIGINLRGASELEARFRRRVTALEQFIDVESKERIAQAIVRELLKALEAFEARGLQAVRDEWESLHADAGKRLRVRLADGRSLSGIATGLAEDGGLRLHTRSGVHAVRSGRVLSSRPA
jgi:BirA family biotin operon repressor/biotin-[acetyl-CoA-carboxylase] ligase